MLMVLWYMHAMHILHAASLSTVLRVVELSDLDICKCQASETNKQNKIKHKQCRQAQTGNILFLFFRPRRAFFFVAAANVSESTEALWMLMSSKSDSSRKSSSLWRRKTERQGLQEAADLQVGRALNSGRSPTEDAFFFFPLWPDFDLVFFGLGFFFASFALLLLFRTPGPRTQRPDLGRQLRSSPRKKKKTQRFPDS